MQKIINVDEELVNEVQSKDIEVLVSQKVISQILDMHKLDKDTSFMESPVFKAYEQESVQKKTEFEKIKNIMFNESVPADIRTKVKSWHLNYFSCELTIEL